jgi:phage-related minor tail protein
MDLAAKVSEQMQTVMNSHTAIAAETAEAFPQLRAMENMFQQVREFSLVEFQFDLLGKSLQLAESNVRQLYQQQG